MNYRGDQSETAQSTESLPVQRLFLFLLSVSVHYSNRINRSLLKFIRRTFKRRIIDEENQMHLLKNPGDNILMVN